MGRSFRLGAVVAVVALSSPALAATATFDDLIQDAIDHPVPSGYIGLDWFNFRYQKIPAVPTGGGIVNGRVSGDYDATSYNQESLAWVSSGTPFTFNSAYLTAAYVDGLSIDIAGYTGGTTPAFDRQVTVDTTGPTKFDFDWAGVTKVEFIYQPDPFDADFGLKNFVLDDLVINAAPAAAAPLPAAVLPALALFAAVAVARRCRRSTSSSPTN